MQINEITYKQIENLEDTQLSRLLLHLLRSEEQKCKLDGVDVLVPLRINVGDAGEDGRIKCFNTNGSKYILNKSSIFQCKATNITPGEIYQEFFESTKRKKSAVVPSLKAQIKDVLDEGGQYVFFIGHVYNQSLKNSRHIQACKAIDDCNAALGTNYLHSQVRVMEASEITEWVNNFLDTIIFTQQLNGIHRPMGLRSIDELASYKMFMENTFHSNEKLDNYISAIRDKMDVDRSSLRIIGHSGLGKTRLVYQALSNTTRGKNSVYYNIIGESDSVVNFVSTYGVSMQGILVCDNCDYRTHKLLKQEIERTNSMFKLISIDYDVNESIDLSKKQMEDYLFLNRYDYVDVVRSILNDRFVNKLSPSQIDQIVSYSEGFPGMAVLFAQVRLNGKEDIVQFLEEDFLDRLAFGSINRKFLTDAEKELFDKQRKFIIEKICDPPTTDREFSQAADYFIGKQVLERRGHYLSVRPTPLAIRLAMLWWKHTSSEYLLSIFSELEKLSLAVPLCNRLSELGQLQEAKEVVNDLWGAESPFGSAEVLNTKLGSRLFRSVAPVNPSVAIDTLESTFGQYSIDDLLTTVGPGRRYIIWTLEMLAFRKDLFERAAVLLFRFAAAENEQISNNASGQLNQLFHVRLSGTEADLKQRISVIDSILNLDDARFNTVLIGAMSSGFEAFNFRRTGGAEQQGLGVELIDYSPSGAEIKVYWEHLLERLIAIARVSPPDRSQIRNALASSIRVFFSTGVSYLAKSMIESYLSIDDAFWREAIIQINTVKRHDNLSDSDSVLVEDLINRLHPISIQDRFRLYVTEPDWDTEKINGGHVDRAAKKAEQLACELVENNIDFISSIDVLLSGEQRKAIEFGKKLGGLLRSYEVAERMLRQLEKINEHKQNSDLIGAYLSMLPREQSTQLIKGVAANYLLDKQAFNLTLHQELRPSDVLFLLELLDEGKTDIKKFYRLGYNFYFRNFEVEAVKDILFRISLREGSAFIVLELIDFYLEGSDDKWHLFEELARRLIIGNNLIINLSNYSEYTWYKFVEILLTNTDDFALVEELTRQLIDSVRIDKYFNFDNYLNEIFKVIIKTNFSIFWKLAGPAILDSETYYSLKSFLGSSNGYMSHVGLLEFANYDMLINWCKNEGPRSYQRIAYMMPLTISGNPTEWHPLALLMFDSFGDHQDFLDEVEANMGSFGSAGSEAPYYENQIALLGFLSDHPKKAVKAWVKRLMEKMEIRVERSKIEDQNHGVNF